MMPPVLLWRVLIPVAVAALVTWVTYRNSLFMIWNVLAWAMLGVHVFGARQRVRKSTADTASFVFLLFPISQLALWSESHRYSMTPGTIASVVVSIAIYGTCVLRTRTDWPDAAMKKQKRQPS